jgi:hypothetical protein
MSGVALSVLGHSDDVASLAFYLTLPALLLLWAWRMMLMSLRWDVSGLTMRTMFWTHRLHWSEIDHASAVFEVSGRGRDGTLLQITRVNGSSVKASFLFREGGGFAEGIAAAINEERAAARLGR